MICPEQPCDCLDCDLDAYDDPTPEPAWRYELDRPVSTVTPKEELL